MSIISEADSIIKKDSDLDSIVREAIAGSSDTVQDACTLPPQAYMSQEFFDLEMEKIFKKDWICVGHTAQIPNVGDYFTIDVLGEPMVVVRGEDKIRALSSVCLHRWAPVVSGSGNTKILSCPFHKWGYALDGQLLGAPFMDQAKGFVAKECRLPEFRSEIVEELGFIFVTFSDTVDSIADRLEPMCERARQENWDYKDMLIVDMVEQDNAYNWKIQVETYMECYHHIGAHKESLEDDSPGGRSWCEEEHNGWTVCHNGTKVNATPEFLLEKPPGFLVLVYPLLMLGRSTKWAGFRILFPVDPNRTKSRIFTLMRKEEVEAPDFPEKMEKHYRLAEIINREDNEVNDLQQFGAASAVAKIGRFSHLEASSWHMAEYVRRCIQRND